MSLLIRFYKQKEVEIQGKHTQNQVINFHDSQLTWKLEYCSWRQDSWSETLSILLSNLKMLKFSFYVYKSVLEASIYLEEAVPSEIKKLGIY